MGNPRSPWGKKTTIAIILFLLTFAWFLSKEVRAETQIGLSAYGVAVGGDRYESETLFILEDFNNEYQAGFLLQLRLDCVDGAHCKRGQSERSNQAFFVQRVVRYNDFEIGMGFSYWHNQTPAWDSHTPYMLSLAYYFNKNLSVGYTHFSTGGSSDHNGGLDMLSLRWNF